MESVSTDSRIPSLHAAMKAERASGVAKSRGRTPISYVAEMELNTDSEACDWARQTEGMSNGNAVPRRRRDRGL